MSDTIETHRILAFQGRVEHLLQQGASRFRGKVSEGTYTGKSAEAVRQFGAVAAQKKVDRHADLPVVSVPTDRRWVDPTRYEFRDFEDDVDRLRTAMESSPRYAESFAKALARAMDDEVIQAATGSARIGEQGAGTETFDTTNFQIASGSASMTIDKLRDAKEKFLAQENDPDARYYCAISAKEHKSLLTETQAISLDYNNKPVLVEGMIMRFMGFDFVHTERLQDDGTDRSCFAWVEDGLHLGIWAGIRTPIDWIPEKQAWQTAGVGDFGATRTQQGKVVNILCAV